MQNNLFKNITQKDFINFDKDQLIQFFDFFEKQKIIFNKITTDVQQLHVKNNILNKDISLILEENENLKLLNKELEDKVLNINNQLVTLKNKLFKRRSEKSSADKNQINDQTNLNLEKNKKKRKKTNLLSSERYPEAPLIERHIELKELPTCDCCMATMEDSGMTENSEFVTVVPKEHIVIRQLRHKYRCPKCYGNIKTAPSPSRIIPGSSYSDEMIIDVAMSKYCDLIPIGRYATMAGREGLSDLPANSLIGTTHALAEIAEEAYHQSGQETRDAINLLADETPHRQLQEHDNKKTWYLWSFSTSESCYFEIRNTRSGDVASEFLSNSKCLYLISDVYSGYGKAVDETNKIRELYNLPKITKVYCNAHSRRKFVEATSNGKNFVEECGYFIDQYKIIYKLEKEDKEDIHLLSQKRAQMKEIFKKMKNHAEEIKNSYSSKSELVKAINYFLGNYEGLTEFLKNPTLPIDNNHSERLLRSPVIGRKTWYGTHSKQGAKTAAILFTLVESCKLNKINPREYFKRLIQSIHNGQGSFTPKTFKSMIFNTG